jgi:Trypsin-like peptidase domain
MVQISALSRLPYFTGLIEFTKTLTRSAVWSALIVMTTAYTSAPTHAQSSDDSLRIYAVNIVKTAPFKEQFTGDGIYLGNGLVITAAHVVGHWPALTHPRVIIAGRDLPAQVVKEGSFEQVDLALLSVEQSQLPVSLRLRRNPLCKADPKVGMAVVDVAPKVTTPSRIISPMLIAPQFRSRFDTLISSPQASGSGLFDAERKCLLGIMSAKIQKYNIRKTVAGIFAVPDGYAGYFVPASKIASFVPPDFRL